jgi:hypothetical protein
VVLIQKLLLRARDNVTEEKLPKHRIGEELMMMLLLMAGVGAFLGGVVAILFGIPVKEFSFGNTLIVVGAMAACTGLIMIALSVVVGELKTIARRVGSRPVAETRSKAGLAPALPDPGEDDFTFPRDPLPQPEEDHFELDAPPISPPARNGINAPRGRPNGQAEPEPAEPSPKARRNLMFASTSRKERERTQVRPADMRPADISAPPPFPPPLVDLDEPQPPSFDDSWSRQERIRPPDPPPLRRAGRPPAAFSDTNANAVLSTRNVDQQAVKVLKSGVVDGMAYSLYSDGSIEAQMPEGLMRFASIDELRSHLEQRPG